MDCARRLKELMPSHKVRCRTTWAGVDGWQWDRFQYQTWAELEGAGEQDGPTELDRMRLAVRLARERAVTDKQGEYLAQVEGGKKAAQVAREAGRHRGTVSRTVGRGRTKIAKEAKALYEVLQAQQGPGPLVVDLADGRVLEAVLSLLTPRQQLYLYLYYGEWLSLREIGRLLRVDHASVLRSIRCGLERLGTLAVGTRAEVRGLEELEERLMAHFNQLEPPEEALRPGPRHRPGRPIPGGLRRSGRPCGPWCCGWCGAGRPARPSWGRACAGRRAAAGGAGSCWPPWRGGWSACPAGAGKRRGGGRSWAACCSNCLNGSGGNCMLTIIEIKDREDGGHGLQSQSHRTECWLEGWLAVPPELEQTSWDCAGYCDLDIQDGKLVGLTPREQPPKPEPEPDLTPQFRTAMLSYAATSTAIPDSYALDMSDLFPTWAAVLADGEELPEGRVLNDGGQLYRVVQAVTPQAHQAPHDEGILAVYRPIDREHAGTADDPIPWVYGMDCHAGKCYRYNGKVYQVAEGGDMIPCTWPPDTPGMWQWEEVQA